MLLPPLHAQQGYVDLATGAGFSVLGGPKDISKDVAQTWYVVLPFLPLPSTCIHHPSPPISARATSFHTQPEKSGGHDTNTEKRDITWSLVQNPALWAFALSQGRDGIAFLQAFRAMRRGYASGSFRYAVMAFAK